MKKKIVSMAMVFAMIAALAIGGTLAYFTDTDYATNTMTYGSVKIEQLEYEREVEDGAYVDEENGYKLIDFVQDKPLLPIVGDPSASGDAYRGWEDTQVDMTQIGSHGTMEVFAGKNAQDKFVVVKNTGKSEAYVRTLIAFEAGEGNSDLLGISWHETWGMNYIGKAKLFDGTNYELFEFIYNGGTETHLNGVVPAGDMTYPSLAQIYLTHETTNEDIELLDGNGNGKLDVLVLSQAAQAAGFENAQTALDTAFGDATVAKMVEWFAEKNTNEQ